MQQTVTIGKKGGKGLEMGIISQVMLRIFDFALYLLLLDMCIVIALIEL